VIEPATVNEALSDDGLILAMQEELNQFQRNDVWDLVPKPPEKDIIGTKWVFRGKRVENVYKINFSKLVDQKVICLLSMNDKKWVWHRRLGQANRGLISKLSKLQLVKGLPNIHYFSDALYGACQRGRIVKSSFKAKDIVSTCRPL